MAFGTISDPVPGTVITVAAYVASALDPIRWLRLLTGNADPPGSSYVVVSDGPAGTTWRKVPADALAAGVAVANLGFTPANAAGQVFAGAISVPSLLTVTAIDALGNGGRIRLKGSGGAFFDIDVDNIGGVLRAYNVSDPTKTFQVNLTTGIATVAGLVAGVNGISSAAGISGASYAGGSTATGSPSFRGVNVGADGIGSAGPISAAAAALVGALTAASAAVVGLITAGSLTLTGAFQAASAIVTGAFQAASATITGAATVGTTLGVTGAQTNLSTMQATQFKSTLVDSVTPVLDINATQSNVVVPNLRAASAAVATAATTAISASTAGTAGDSSLLGGVAPAGYALEGVPLTATSGAYTLTTSVTDVPSVIVTLNKAGKWAVTAKCIASQAAADGSIVVTLVQDASTGLDQANLSSPGAQVTLPLAALVTSSGTTTVKVRAMKTSGVSTSALGFIALVAAYQSR